MQLNGVDLVERNNRPSVNNKVAIRTLFINNGQFIDPYDVSACTIFSKLANTTPSSVLDSSANTISTTASSVCLMNFEVSGDPDLGNPHDGVGTRVTSQNLGWVDPTLYTPGTNASGIYRSGVGDYVVVLDGSLDLSGGYNLNVGFNQGVSLANQASSVQDYIDIWTVKLFESSEYQTFINYFKLYNDTFTTITEPLLITTKEKLVNKHIKLGSVIDLKIPVEITVQNKTIPEETKNILKDINITNPQVKIEKVNEDSTSLPSRTLIIDFTNTNITSDNTILYNFDTNTVSNTLLGAGVGGPAGTYVITVKYTYLNQTFVSSPFYFSVS